MRMNNPRLNTLYVLEGEPGQFAFLVALVALRALPNGSMDCRLSSALLWAESQALAEAKAAALGAQIAPDSEGWGRREQNVVPLGGVAGQ